MTQCLQATISRSKLQKMFPLSNKYMCANIKSQNPNAPPGVYMLKNSILACCKDDTIEALNLELALNSNSVINQRTNLNKVKPTSGPVIISCVHNIWAVNSCKNHFENFLTVQTDCVVDNKFTFFF